jgi:hypothetical protein
MPFVGSEIDLHRHVTSFSLIWPLARTVIAHGWLLSLFGSCTESRVGKLKQYYCCWFVGHTTIGDKKNFDLQIPD